ncbi:exopolyphosphatase [Aerococcus urinaehominis]|uniref:Exopolyphosphatase n=1 Tax=Aerococcus urinaehominis TaxID=128944 RepID=A0A0X8FMH7_9LACT|nr:Ppx/GppA family phosphatase [Aerococcus urinaehominis]AMB99799.1 exopolyphosphatase [Aerococcus urinaehominis]SDM08592.1 exopolyphosphatase / guanosine-5'-triphosphate,3'-diphosphate pyrophosphatase [Aerococcus urinaehominis]
MKERIALIDIGSNTIRLVIFQLANNLDFREIQNIKVPARLFQYLEDGVMRQEGIDCLCDIMDAFNHEAAIMKCDQILPKATAAIRQSANVNDIIDQVKKRTGLTIDLVSGPMEAYYGFNAVIHTMADREAVTVDIGGGSTEITYFKDKQIVHSHSFPFGAVTLQSLFFQGKAHNDKKAIKKTRAYIQAAFSDQPFMKDLKLPIIAIGGSARNVARVHQAQTGYTMGSLHNYVLAPDDLTKVLDYFGQVDADQMDKVEGLNADRADIIVPASLVFTELVNFVQAPCFKFSNNGLREGILYQYVQDRYPGAYDINQVATESVERLADRYHFSMADGAQRMVIAQELAQAMIDAGLLKLTDQESELLRYGAYAYFLGKAIDPAAASQHSFYILSNISLFGFSHQDQLALALVASYKNKGLFKQYSQTYPITFSSDQLKCLQHIGGIIKFAECLNDSHYNIVKDIKLVKKKGDYRLEIYYHGNLIAEPNKANNQIKHIERIVGADLAIDFIKAK